jgi:hypothetical protein
MAARLVFSGHRDSAVCVWHHYDLLGCQRLVCRSLLSWHKKANMESHANKIALLCSFLTLLSSWNGRRTGNIKIFWKVKIIKGNLQKGRGVFKPFTKYKFFYTPKEKYLSSQIFHGGQKIPDPNLVPMSACLQDQLPSSLCFSPNSLSPLSTHRL